MSIIGSTIGSLAKLAVVLVVLGVITGLAVSGIDLLSPRTSAAKARQVDTETTHMAQVYSIQEQQLAEAQRHQMAVNQSQEQQLAAQNQLDLKYAQERAELKLELLAVRERALSVGGATSMVVMSVGVSYLLIKLGQRWANPALQTPHLASNGNARQAPSDENARLLAALLARDRKLREAFAKPVVQDPIVSGDNGKHLQPVI